MTLPDLGGLGGTFWSTLIGAVVGAVVAGLINLALQWSGIVAARAAKRQESLAAAFSVMVKVIKMLSHISHIRDQVARAQQQLSCRAPADLWMVMQSFATMPPALEFNEAESAFILSTRERNLMLEAIELADVHNDLLNLVTSYSTRRESLTSSLPVEAMRGSHGTTSLDPNGMLKFGPAITQVHSLAQAIKPRADDDYAQARRVFDGLKAHCMKRFGKDFPALELTGQASASPERTPPPTAESRC